MENTLGFPDHFFRRVDETDDRLFYTAPRLVVHIDEFAIAAIRRYFSEVLPEDGAILDLMSSWRSHMPEEPSGRTVLGLGLNAVEMQENPQLDDFVVHDLNLEPDLPFDDHSFDAAVVTVSVQYMTRPVEVFSEVRRSLKEGAGFHVIYSNRMFPTKAVALWQSLDDHRRGQLVGAYFVSSGGWEDVTIKRHQSRGWATTQIRCTSCPDGGLRRPDQRWTFSETGLEFGWAPLEGPHEAP